MDVRATIEALGLQPHPEGGFFREVVRSAAQVPHPAHGAARAAFTSIHFLLPAGTFSAWHRVSSDELWIHLDGGPLGLHLLSEAAGYREQRLGPGGSYQTVVPAGVWQAAMPAGDRASLCACVVAPGFDFADFEMPTRVELLEQLPAFADAVRRFTRA